MKLALLTALSLPFFPAAVGENYVQTVIHEVLGAEQPAAFETTSCRHFNINSGEEGCAAGEMCKIGVGDCLYRIRKMSGVCYTRPERCTFDFNPVCGCDGVTYSNECKALGAGVNIMNVGCCSDDEECKDSLEPDEPTPVEPTTCTYFNINREEGCADDDMCKIGVGNCRRRIRRQEGVCYTPPQMCTFDWNPVCGCDGVTYSNECSALSAGVNIMNVGCCSDDEECKDSLEPDEPTPVEPTPCTYFNENDAEGCAAGDMCKIDAGNCLLYIAWQDGVCVTPPEVCTADYNPVCGCDGVTYSNECKALGRGVNVQSVGPCRDEDSTPTEWPTWSPPSNDYRCFTDTNPGERPSPICPGNSDDEYCDGGGDCEGSGFCDCLVGHYFCDWGFNPCNDIDLETNN